MFDFRIKYELTFVSFKIKHLSFKRCFLSSSGEELHYHFFFTQHDIALIDLPTLPTEGSLSANKEYLRKMLGLINKEIREFYRSLPN